MRPGWYSRSDTPFANPKGCRVIRTFPPMSTSIVARINRPSHLLQCEFPDVWNTDTFRTLILLDSADFPLSLEVPYENPLPRWCVHSNDVCQCAGHVALRSGPQRRRPQGRSA